MPKKLTLDIAEGSTMIKVTESDTAKPNFSTTFTIDPSALASVFSSNWNTGLLPTQEGTVYMESRDGYKFIALFRPIKRDFIFNDAYEGTKTPYACPNSLFCFLVKEDGAGVKVLRNHLFLLKNPILSLDDTMYDGYWLWNYYSNYQRNLTNICWGSAPAFSDGKSVSLNFLNSVPDLFYTQRFTNHLCKSRDGWEKFTKTLTLPSETTAGTFRAFINESFGNVR